MILENIVKFKEAALHLKPKRSPIFLALTALVLIYVTPLMLDLIGHSFRSLRAIAIPLFNGEGLDLGEKLSGWDLFFINGGFFILTLSLVIAFAAMVTLTFKKYWIARRLLVAAPLCCWFGYNLMGNSHFFARNTGDVNVMALSAIAPYLPIALILYLYAKKYTNLDRMGETA